MGNAQLFYNGQVLPVLTNQFTCGWTQYAGTLGGTLKNHKMEQFQTWAHYTGTL